MPVRIRLQRGGRKQRPYYKIVVADSRARRDGRFIERIGDYNPTTIPATINLDDERAFHWVMEGAQPSDTVRAILSYRGVMFRKHLQRGVSKGAMTQEEADKKYQDWVAEKDQEIANRIQQLAADKESEAAKRLEAESAKRAEMEAARQPEPEEEEVAEAATEGEEAAEEGEAPAEEASEDAQAAEAPAEEAPVEEAPAEEAPAEADKPAEEAAEEGSEEAAEEGEAKD